MKTRKRWLSLGLAICMLTGLMPEVTLAGEGKKNSGEIPVLTGPMIPALNMESMRGISESQETMPPFETARHSVKINATLDG